VPGESSSTISELRKMRSSCGPKLSPQMVYIAETMLLPTIRGRRMHVAKMLKAIGYSLSGRSKKHTWLRRVGARVRDIFGQRTVWIN